MLRYFYSCSSFLFNLYICKTLPKQLNEIFLLRKEHIFKDKILRRKLRESVTKTPEFQNHVDRSRKITGRNQSYN